MAATDKEVVTPQPTGGEEKILVSVRLRPLNEKETARNDVSDWECISDNTIMYKNNISVPDRSMFPSTCAFDKVFSPDCSTRQVYEYGAKEVALSVVNGINSSVFAYGQTSSGKTYTMGGITGYSVADIYNHVEKHNEREYILKFSAMEIYNECVRDLLSMDTTPLRLLDDPDRGTVVERLTEETLRDWDHFKELICVCEAQRQVGETSMNEASSRSHQILRLTIESSARELLGNDKSSSLAATVNFVDLAGSERASQLSSAGVRLKEGSHINRSLLTLGTVIRKLSKGRNGHIPFRDSKLTRILQSSLGGNARTAIICTISPARSHVEQSRNTLLFASCAKEVTTNAHVNVVVSDKALVKQLQKELARLESQFRSAGSDNVRSDSKARLREKDLQIEKLMKEVGELNQRLQLAHHQVENLLRVTEDDRASTVSGVPDHCYPKLRVQNSFRSENSVSYSFASEDSHFLDIRARSFGACQCSGENSSTSEENYVHHLANSEEKSIQRNSSPELSDCIANPIGTDPHVMYSEEENYENFDTTCKEVQCITDSVLTTEKYGIPQIFDTSLHRHSDSNISSHNIHVATSGLTGAENEVVDGESTTEKYENSQIFDSSLDRYADSNISNNMQASTSGLAEAENGDTEHQDLGSSLVMEQKDLNCQRSGFITLTPEKPFPWLREEGITRSKSQKMIRSRSCGSRLADMSPCLLKKTSNDSALSMGDLTKITEASQRELTEFKYGPVVEELSRKVPSTFVGCAAVDDHQFPSAEASIDWKSASGVSNSDAEMKYIVDYLEQQDTTSHAIESAETVKDIALDPIQDDSDLGNDKKWPLEFKRLQGEIIELWQACSVSLIHRTYFFLLFKGDPSDYFYMEVEIRRLSFLKDTFSKGNETVVDGGILSLASSKKALNRERQMLCRQMQKKLSREERENLFKKWGIPLTASNRRMQLLQNLWNKTTDMDHIIESANLVAKLIGFVEDQEQTMKQMFGLLNFTPCHSIRQKSSIWKLNVLSFL